MELICPYPGLRPFNEEESIFFKGRELQVERIVKKLEEKKFLMVNGASGDGKSSLIFAGVIPYAKAGFFKAQYNNWLVADFRPERSPLRNLTASLCKQLKIEDVTGTEKKLGYGFSALCELYKASPFFIDESKSEWLSADETQKKTLKRKGANLLVLVDQFEEFFTNPENYQNGVPSLESQKTINLLLETYKIAAQQNLPIYVVCTMRSDYIGQCAAFRGLPEAIGYSQFFVPRLKRQEIEQAIEGPAELAGCKISKRLTQTLLNSLNDGFDQLPILQHALNRIWKEAENGTEEMDLIHLARVGGISSQILGIEDRKTFSLWFEKQRTYKKELFEKPSLNNVLNAHANELLFLGEENLNSLSEIEKTQKLKIIKKVFQSLTGYDKGRVVRRRATMNEVLELVNQPGFTLADLNKILLPYRDENSSFIKPYVSEAGENITGESILDITHESLIRNWKLLENWVLEEEENVQTWMEIEKPLRVWLKNTPTKSKFIFWSWRFNEVQKYTLSAGLFEQYQKWRKTHPVYLSWLKKISPNYDNQDIENFNLFLTQSKQVQSWNKAKPFLFGTILLIILYSRYQVSIAEKEEAIKNEKVQKELLEKVIKNQNKAAEYNLEANRQKALADKAQVNLTNLNQMVEKERMNLEKEKKEAILLQNSLAEAGLESKRLNEFLLLNKNKVENFQIQLEELEKKNKELETLVSIAKTDEEKFAKEKSMQAAKIAMEILNEKRSSDEMQRYLNDLSLIYPEGKTTLQKKYSDFELTTIIIVKNKNATEYKKIKFSWGSYFKKNGRDISKNTFLEETKD